MTETDGMYKRFKQITQITPHTSRLDCISLLFSILGCVSHHRDFTRLHIDFTKSKKYRLLILEEIQSMIIICFTK